MDNENLNPLKLMPGEKNNLLSPVLVLSMAFLIVLIVFVGVSAAVRIKEGKYIGTSLTDNRTISVRGSSEMYVKPDLAIVTFSVVNEGKTATQAMDLNATKMNAVIAAIKGEGISEKDMKTTSFSIYPRYDYYSGTAFYPQGRRVLAGYDVSQSLEVKIRDLSKVSDVIATSTAAGSNEIGGLTFTLDNPEEFKAKVREQAIKDAKEKARILALQLGIRLVRIANFEESGGVPMPMFETVKGIGGGDSTAPQVQPGENKIQSTVIITYEIQ